MKKKQFKIGLDIHGVVSSMPEIFKELTDGWIRGSNGEILQMSRLREESKRMVADEITKAFNALFIQKSNLFPPIVNHMNNTVNGIPMEKLYRLQNDIEDFADEAVKKLIEEVPEKKQKLPRKVRNW